jgi:pentatricopeptide repeat protein
MADQLDLNFWSLTNERYPDLGNTWEALWVEGLQNSPWVAAQIAAKAPGIVQFNIFACNRKLTKDVKDGRLEKVMQFFQQMRQQGVSPNKFTFIQVIKACAAL